MAYKPRIESNNLDLTSILSTINELPDAGGGGGGSGSGVETCNVTFIYKGATKPPVDLAGNIDIRMINLDLDEGVWYPYIYDDFAIVNTTIVNSVIVLFGQGATLPQFSVESLDGTSHVIWQGGGDAEIYIGYSDTTITIFDA